MNIFKELQQMAQETALQAVAEETKRIMMIRRAAEVVGVDTDVIDTTIQVTGKEAMKKYKNEIKDISDANRIMRAKLEELK